MYDNIHIGSEVDVSRSDGEILKGKVRWKGSIANRKGNWIGVELDTPDGKHDGILNRRRYFQCKAYRGIFVRPSQVRFSLKQTRRKYVKYRTLSSQSIVDEALFFRGNLEASQPGGVSAISMDSHVFEQIKDIMKDSRCEFPYQQSTHRKAHMIGNHLRPAKHDCRKGGLSFTSLQISPRDIKRTDPSSNYFLPKSSRSWTAHETFRSPSSIPVIDRKPAHCSSTEHFYEMKSISKHSLNKTL